jgi:hypothetical protein
VPDPPPWDKDSTDCSGIDPVDEPPPSTAGLMIEEVLMPWPGLPGRGFAVVTGFEAFGLATV